jgi:hypothetical protein
MSETCAASAAIIAAWLSISTSAILDVKQVHAIRDPLSPLLDHVEASFLRGRVGAAIALAEMAQFCGLSKPLAGIDATARQLLATARRLEGEIEVVAGPSAGHEPQLRDNARARRFD